MPTKDELFNSYTAGRLPDSLKSDVATLLAPYLAVRNDLVGQMRVQREVFKDITVELVDELQLNALAFVTHGAEFVGINAGMALSLPLLFHTLLSHPSVFPDIGRSDLEHDRTVVLDEQLLFARGRVSEIEPGHTWTPKADSPRDETRRHYATYLAVRAWGFVISHEIGHILRCHLQYLRDHHSLAPNVANVLQEFGECDEADLRSVRRSLEIDADVIAAQVQIGGVMKNTLLQHRQQVHAETAFGWVDVLRHWLRAVDLVFQLLALLDASPVLGAGRTHPHPDVRLRLLAEMARGRWRDRIPDDQTYIATVVGVHREIRDFWQLLRLPMPISRSDPNYLADLQRSHHQLSDQFWALAEPLNRLTTLRVAASGM